MGLISPGLNLSSNPGLILTPPENKPILSLFYLKEEEISSEFEVGPVSLVPWVSSGLGTSQSYGQRRTHTSTDRRGVLPDDVLRVPRGQALLLGEGFSRTRTDSPRLRF